MRKILPGLLATTLAATFVVSSALPLNAAPVSVAKPLGVQSDVQNVQYGPEWRRMHRDHERRRLDRRLDRQANAGFERRGRTYFLNGREGSRFRREGYRRYNGWWFPAAAFTTGAIVGGATANANRRLAANDSAHVQWCYNRFRSYRSSDNTFQPTSGPRRECISLYS